MTLDRLWDEYKEQRPDSKSMGTDKGLFEKHINRILAKKNPMKL
jgi:hypothetical protein